MSEMIDRVAKAILAEAFDPMEEDEAIVYARAAIAAMRKPTPGVIEAAIKTWDPYAAGHRLLPDDVEDIWESMIDEALK